MDSRWKSPTASSRYFNVQMSAGDDLALRLLNRVFTHLAVAAAIIHFARRCRPADFSAITQSHHEKGLSGEQKQGSQDAGLFQLENFGVSFIRAVRQRERASSECTRPLPAAACSWRGQGLMAGPVGVKKGQLILAEAPIVSLDEDWGLDSKLQSLQAQLQALPPVQRAAFAALTDCTAAVHEQPQGSALANLGIFKTNALPKGYDTTEAGLFPTMSRVNHSCAPNVHHSWHPDSGKVMTAFERQLFNCSSGVCCSSEEPLSIDSSFCSSSAHMLHDGRWCPKPLVYI